MNMKRMNEIQTPLTEEQMEKLMKEYNKNPNRPRPITRQEIQDIENMKRFNRPVSEDERLEQDLARGLFRIGFDSDSKKLFVDFTMHPSEDPEQREFEQRILRILIKEAIIPRVKDYTGKDNEILYIKNMYDRPMYRSSTNYFGSRRRRIARKSAKHASKRRASKRAHRSTKRAPKRHTRKSII